MEWKRWFLWLWGLVVGKVEVVEIEIVVVVVIVVVVNGTTLDVVIAAVVEAEVEAVFVEPVVVNRLEIVMLRTEPPEIGENSEAFLKNWFQKCNVLGEGILRQKNDTENWGKEFHDEFMWII